MILKIPCNRPCHLEHKSFLLDCTAHPLHTAKNILNIAKNSHNFWKTKNTCVLMAHPLWHIQYAVQSSGSGKGPRSLLDGHLLP